MRTVYKEQYILVGEKLIQTGTTLYGIVSERDGTFGSLDARRSFIGGVYYRF